MADEASIVDTGNNTQSYQSPVEQRLLETLVPVNALTVDHLNTLLRDCSVEIVLSGQPLFECGDYDNKHVYLLSGEVKLTNNDGEETAVMAENPEARYPLAHHQPRRNSAIAVTDCSLIRFDSDKLDSMLAWDQASNYIMLDIASQRDLDEDADWMLTLLKSNLFYKVPPMNIRDILNKFTPEYFVTGDTVIRQGELGECCYYIKEGIAGVYQSVDDKSSPALVAELGVGRCFGEDALVNETVRNATIEMHSNGVLMKLNKQDFFLLLKPPAVDHISFVDAVSSEQEDCVWIDVRTQDEFEKGHKQDAINMPLNLLKLKSRMLNKDQRHIVYCNSGRRSDAAAYLLGQEGFKIASLSNGVAGCSIYEQQQFETHA